MQISCHLLVANASLLDRQSLDSHYSLGTSAWNKFAGDGKGGYPDNRRVCDNNWPARSMAPWNPGSLEQFLEFTGGPTPPAVIFPAIPPAASKNRPVRMPTNIYALKSHFATFFFKKFGPAYLAS